MPSQFTASDVEAIAALAQLELESAEIDLFARQLGDFLAYANEVLSVDTEGVAPTAYVATSHESERPDVVRSSLDRETVLLNAPEPAPEAGFFKVPRVIG
jgi:aspartyl-tRNA(Asn)/glutamyl-tRNA(Gln) amidotransferase subunit C